MIQLVIATVLFLALHFGLAAPPVRSRIIAVTGEMPYRGLFSLAATVLIVWVALGYRGAPYVGLWAPAAWQHWLAIILMLPATILIVCGMTQPNPTAVGGGELPPQGSDMARGALRVTRHPMMWGFGLWGIVHAIANGHLAGLILFGGMTILALAGTLAIDAKHALRDAERWRDFAAATSNLPFAAIIAGRQKLPFGEVAPWRPAAGVLLWIALMALHPYVIGVSVLPA